MPLTVRTAGPADVALVAEFNRRLALETENVQLDRDVVTRGVAALVADPAKGWYTLACDGDDVVGQCAVSFEWSDWRDGWWWWLQSVFVRADARGRGVFRVLYQSVCHRARQARDVIGIRLYVEHSNAAGQSVYRALGMNPTTYHVYEQLLSPDQR
jgi:GNAT superfamily N-acetyltransferase